MTHYLGRVMTLLILGASSTLGQTNPIENQTTEIIDGTSWILPHSNELHVGYSTWGNGLIITNAGYMDSGPGFIGVQAGADSNRVIVTGSGSIWTNAEHLIVGTDGASYNTMDILDGGAVYNQRGIIGAHTGSGNYSSSSNSVLVSGNGSIWNNADDVFVGSWGQNNALYIDDQAYVQSTAGYIGYKPSANNNVAMISWTGTVWSNQYHLHVGSEGTDNILSVSDGAAIYNQAEAIGSSYGSSNNIALITGSNSLWQCDGDLHVGFAGSYNSLVVSNGAAVDNWFSRIGHDPGSDGNSVLVTGNGSVFKNQVLLRIGDHGAGNQLAIEDGGLVRVELYGATIGEEATSSNNLVTINGSGSSLYCNDNLYVGSKGSNNELIISDTGYVENYLGRIGESISSDHNAVLITGEGSFWLNRMHVAVGDAGSFNTMIISNGGKVVNAIGDIGLASTSSNNTALVTGTNSRWQNYEILYIGHNGSNNRLTISDGGSLHSTYAGVLGYETNSGNNSARITGENSNWYACELIAVGGYGSDNELTVEDEAGVVCGNGYIGYYETSSNNLAIITGKNSSWKCTQSFHIGGHPDEPGSSNNVVVLSSGAELSTGLLTIRPGNEFQLLHGGRLEADEVNGDLSVGGTVAVGRDAEVVWVHGALSVEPGGCIEMIIGGCDPGANLDHLVVTGQTTLTGTLDIQFADGFVPTFGTFDILSLDGGRSGTFDTINLPILPFGQVWDTNDIYTTGRLHITYDTSDTNGNGIEDGWEFEHFGTGISATNDPDKDLFSNLKEFIVGTDPNDGTSMFVISNATQSMPDFVIEWAPCIPNRLYSINWSPSLTNGFQSLETGIEYPQNTFTDAVNTAQGFYNVEVQLK